MKRLALSLVVCLITLPVRAGDGEGAKQDFAQKAAVSNIFEIEAAKIEISQGRAVAAKQFAQDMLGTMAAPQGCYQRLPETMASPFHSRSMPNISRRSTLIKTAIPQILTKLTCRHR